ncbi:hypothetical protein DXG01_010363 [Tephrocybe rancida]|nr:hypothetical protein DXG01_010363 [Tephrocybe rancida]
MNGNKETYTAGEKNSFKMFRGNFLKEGSTEACEQVIRKHMLPALIQFWHDTNNPWAVGIEGPMVADKQNNIVKELKHWAVNNWHRDNNRNDGSHELKVNVSTIVDRLYPERVNEVLCDLIGVNELGRDRQREFEQRKHTIRKVQDELSTMGFAHVWAEKAQLGVVSNPLDIQCKYVLHSLSIIVWAPLGPVHRLAKTQAVARIKGADTKRLKEMGMVSLTLVGWVNENGKMGVELHDYIAELKGIRKLCFSDMYQDLSTEMIDKFMLYLFSLRGKRFGLGPLVAVPEDPGLDSADILRECPLILGITYNSDGYPRLPQDIPVVF